MIKDVKPKDFNPKFEVVSCFIISDGKILVLKRQSNKPQGNTWGVPSGKKDEGESLIEALVREVNEETGINLKQNEINFYKTKYVEYDDFQFIYHVYACERKEKPEVTINNIEHQEYRWEEPKECLNLNLIQDEDECIIDYFKLESK